MDNISKKEFENLIRHGIASHIFIAERAYSMFKTIGDKSNDLSGRNGYQGFLEAHKQHSKTSFYLLHQEYLIRDQGETKQEA